MSSSGEEPTVSYEQLAEIEKELDDVELEIVRYQAVLTAPIYKKRKAFIANIPGFWALVLEQVPPDIEQYIQPSDSKVFVSCLKDIEVTRFEIPPYAPAEAKGSPRSVAIRFEFGPNQWFLDEVLEKKFWFRRNRDGWTGLVSEPVKIHWRKGMDLSEGLTDAAVNAWEAEKMVAAKDGDMPKDGLRDGLSSLGSVQAELERLAGESMQGSFFTWFAYRGKHVTAAENVEAIAKEEERRVKVKAGEPVSLKGVDYEEEEDVESIEDQDMDLVFPMGEELAIAISEDVYPGALKYFTMAQEQEDLSEMGSIDSDDTEAVDMERVLDVGDDEDDNDTENERPKKKAKT